MLSFSIVFFVYNVDVNLIFEISDLQFDDRKAIQHFF